MFPISAPNPLLHVPFDIDNQNVLHSEWQKEPVTAFFGGKMQQIRVFIQNDGNIVLQKVEQTMRERLFNFIRNLAGQKEEGISIVSTQESHLAREISSLKEKEKQWLQEILNSKSVPDIPTAINTLMEEIAKKTDQEFSSAIQQQGATQIPTELEAPPQVPSFAFIKITDYVNSHLTENPVINRNMKAMAEALDQHVQTKYAKQIKHDIKHAQQRSPEPLTDKQKKAIEQRVQKKFQESLIFFTQVDKRKSPDNPLERMASTFAYLNPSSEVSFIEGSSQFAAQLAILAFEQHRENPEQYVSHGFDHSINVANYMRAVLKMNPQIVEAMSSKYKISEGEALFLLENVAFLHDTGYPCVGHRTKAVHGISGADLILSMHPMFDKIITSPEVDKEVLFNDFRNAIMFHSADKVESAFGAKIQTTMGTFLTEPKNIVTVLSNFYDPKKNPSYTPRYALEIFVQNPQEKEEIEKALVESRAVFESLYGKTIVLPKVNIHEGLFQGRFADLEINKDKLIGLEFSVTDLLENPLNMIRLVDNMDMRNTRLTPTQNETSFREIYARLGDHQGVSQLAVELETFERRMDKKKQAIPKEDQGQQALLAEEVEKGTQEILKRHSSQMEGDILEKQVKNALQSSSFTEIKTVKEARDLLNQVLINVIFKQDQWMQLPIEKQEDVRFIGMQQSSYDFRHFGGTEAITEVQLKSIPRLEPEPGQGDIPCVVVTVNRQHFEDLNKVKVNEEGILVGIGEYQIWRASDAYKSLVLGNTKVQLQIMDEAGLLVECIVNQQQ